MVDCGQQLRTPRPLLLSFRPTVGGASAFDNAQHALICGAGEVHVFVRRKVCLCSAVLLPCKSDRIAVHLLLLAQQCGDDCAAVLNQVVRQLAAQELPRINPIRKMEFAGEHRAAGA